MSLSIPLTKPICFFDVESTGLNIMKDRIIQIALVKYSPGSDDNEELEMMINPGIPISPEAKEVHGISNEDVRNKPTFIQVAEKIFDFIADSDIGGYNSNRFDLPILMEEFSRAGLNFDLDNRRLIDVQKIFYKMEPRTLRAALRFYCGENLTNAHDALADVRATVSVLKGQIKKYEGIRVVDEEGFEKESPITADIQALHDFTVDNKMLDVTQRLRYNSAGEVVFNFGKNIGKPVGQTLYNDRQYYHWIMEKEFPVQVKNLVTKLLQEYQEEKSKSELKSN